MKGRAKGRALERRPFEKRHSRESLSCAGCVVGAVCAPESGDVWRLFGACLALQSSPIARKTRPCLSPRIPKHSDIFPKKLSPAPEAFRKRFHGWTDEKPLETEAALLGCLDISYS